MERSSPVLQRFPKLYIPHYSQFAKLDQDFDCRTAGKSARAKLLTWKATTQTEGAWSDSTSTIQIYAPPKNMLGVILTGMTVRLKWVDGPGWIVVAGGKARKIMFTADADFVSGSSTIAGHVVDWDDGEDPDAANNGISVTNPHKFAGKTASMWEATYWPSYDRYSCIQGYCDPSTTGS